MANVGNPIFFTRYEGGYFEPWQRAGRKKRGADVVHSIVFDDGRVFDTRNGWRKEVMSQARIREIHSRIELIDRVASCNVENRDFFDNPDWMEASRHGVERALENVDAIREEAPKEPSKSPLAYIFLKHALRYRTEYLESC